MPVKFNDIFVEVGVISSEFNEDLKKYPKRPFFKEQSIWAVAVYRWGRRINELKLGTVKKIYLVIYWPVFRFVETVTGISLPIGAEIGPGLRIWHFGNIFINSGAVIGENCTLRQGVTIGNRHENGPLPVIGDNVEFGAYAQVLGGVRIGDNAKIAAMSVVLEDVPNNATVAGIPAKVVKIASVNLSER